MLSIQALHIPYSEIPYSEKFNKKLLSSINHFVATRMVCRNIPVLVSRPYQMGHGAFRTPFLIQYAVFFGAPHW